MATPSSSPTPAPAGGNPNPTPIDPAALSPGLEERLRLMWERNRKLVLVVVIFILLVIVGQGAWEYLEEQRERGVREAYAAATTTPQLKAFAGEHPEHPLAAAAQLRIADEAYAQRRFADAIAPYEQAASVLKTGPLASRARLGAAMAKHQAGRAAEGEAALKAFANDASEIKAYRAEAMAHLASLAAAAGNAADVKAYSDQLMQLDPANPWTQRTLQLLATLPPVPASAAPESSGTTSPAITLPEAGKK